MSVATLEKSRHRTSIRQQSRECALRSFKLSQENRSTHQVEKGSMPNSNSLTVAVLGASDRPDRYSYQAIRMLQGYGHRMYPISHRNVSLPGLTTYASIAELPNLHYLGLQGNPIQQLPIEIASMPQLITLNLSHTGLKSIPDAFKQIPNLLVD